MASWEKRKFQREKQTNKQHYHYKHNFTRKSSQWEKKKIYIYIYTPIFHKENPITLEVIYTFYFCSLGWPVPDVWLCFTLKLMKSAKVFLMHENKMCFKSQGSLCFFLFRTFQDRLFWKSLKGKKPYYFLLKNI